MPLDLTKTILMFLQNNLDSVYANHLKLISQCIWQYMGQHRLWLLFLLRFQRYALNIWLPCSMFEYNVIFTMTYRLWLVNLVNILLWFQSYAPCLYQLEAWYPRPMVTFFHFPRKSSLNTALFWQTRLNNFGNVGIIVTIQFICHGIAYNFCINILIIIII